MYIGEYVGVEMFLNFRSFLIDNCDSMFVVSEDLMCLKLEKKEEFIL